MLVAISDLHLTDCSTATNPHATAIELLMKEIEANLKPKGAKELRFLLLGDIFDLVRTDYWHRNVAPEQRPWGGELDPATGMNIDPDVERQFQEVLARVLDAPSSKALIAGIKGFAETSNLPTSVQYVRGNHDRVLNNFASLERQIADAFAPVKVDFANEYHASEYAVFARHGHQWEDNTHGWKLLTNVLSKGSKAKRFDPETHRVMAIGEVITAELMSGFVFHVKQRLGEEHPFSKLAAEVNNVRPMQDVVAWLTWLMEEEFENNVEVARKAFLAALEGTLGCSLAREWDKLKTDLGFSSDITDFLTKVHWALEHEKGLDWVQSAIRVIDDVKGVLTMIRGHREDDLYKGAAGELEGDDLPSGVQYLLYGHTHTARQRCIEAERDGPVRMYVNTGTFLPLIEHADDRKSFFRSNRMTFVCFYRDDEDRASDRGDGPVMDVWDGMKRKDYL